MLVRSGVNFTEAATVGRFDTLLLIMMMLIIIIRHLVFKPDLVCMEFQT